MTSVVRRNSPLTSGFLPDGLAHGETHHMGLPSRAEGARRPGLGVPPNTGVLRRARTAAGRGGVKGVGGMQKKLWLLAVGVVALIGAGVVGALAISADDPDAPPIRAAAESTGAAEENEAEAEGEGEFGDEGEEEEEEEGLGPAEPDDYFLFQRSTRGKVPDSQDFTRAVRQAQEVRAASAPGVAGTSRHNDPWELVGPTNVGGRLPDIAV